MADTHNTGALGRALIRGRIRSVRKARGQRQGWLHVLVMPAADEFTAPGVVEVFSKERLGDPDDSWQGAVQIGGYGRSYRTEETDAHGDTRSIQVQTADVSLTACP